MRTNAIAAAVPNNFLITGKDVRQACRSNTFVGPTSGLAPGSLQGDFVILPRDYAEEFLRFCLADPKPCLLLDVTDAENPIVAALIATMPAGRFRGPLVMSMRPLKPADAIHAIQITTRLRSVHGAPVHIGFLEAIGIIALEAPDEGDAVPIEPGELPAFWALRLNPQAAIAAVHLRFAFTHAPGRVLVPIGRTANSHLF